MMRLIALEIVGIASAEQARLFADRDLQAACQNNAALLALVDDVMATRAGPRLIALLEHLYGLGRQVRADLSIRYVAIGD